MNPQRTVPPLLVALSLVLCSTAWSQSGPIDERQRVEILLSAYEGFPKPGDFLKVSSDPGAVMRDIVEDPHTKAHIRLGALSALALFPDEKVWELYMSELQKSGTNPAPRATHQVLGGLALGFGPRAVDVLANYLKHDDTQVRMTAAHALGTIGTADARSAILERASLESDPVVAKYLRDQVP